MARNWLGLAHPRMSQRALSPASETPFARPAWQSYGFAGLMLIIALIVRRLLDPVMGDSVPLATMYVGVAFAVWFGGWKPAALVAIIGYFAALALFLPPRFTFKLWESLGAPRMTLYFVSCGITVYLCESIRRAQQKKAASEARVVSILDHMREGFCSVDADWRITAINRSAEACLGQPRASLVTRRFWEVVPRTVGTAAEKELRHALGERTPVQFETDAIVPDTWHAVTATPADGGLALFFQDITAKKARVDQLEYLVRERTADLQRLVVELESFSYTLVHDMRAPLRSISSFAELLASDHARQLDLDGRNYLERIRKSARRMDRLITDILDYSQLSRAKPELHPVDLHELVREILDSYPGFQPDKADIRLVGVLPEVRGNEALLTQLFSNLLHNAVKFVAPGVKPQITIAAHLEGAFARVDVSDNGIGISPDASARIFEPFRREHPNYDGTGIGLAIVRKVVDLLEGRIGVESQIGRGSRFWIQLHLTRPIDASAPAAAAARVLV